MSFFFTSNDKLPIHSSSQTIHAVVVEEARRSDSRVKREGRGLKQAATQSATCPAKIVTDLHATLRHLSLSTGSYYIQNKPQ